MKLKRYRTYTLWDEEGNPLDERLRSVFRVFDVLEWRDSIRAAVEAERASMRETNGRVLPGAALDALLAGGGA